MPNNSFEASVPAKWILCGEHSVLRGKRALAFPYPKFSLQLKYQAQDQGVCFADESLAAPALALIDRAKNWLGVDTPLTGQFKIEASIPIGAGLGSSAALSVAVARFALWKFAPEKNNPETVIQLATHLEDLFHGKSSGLDVNVVAKSLPMIFSTHAPASAIKVDQFPRFELIDTGLRGPTKDCIAKVKDWAASNAKLATEMDEQMGQATERAAEALLSFAQDPKKAEAEIATAMNNAHSCFEAWGLVPEQLQQQRNRLLKDGALAVKLTGAGLGGYWVALKPTP